MTVSIQALSQELVSILENDAALNAVRAGIRGEETYGLTEHCALIPAIDEDGVYAVQGYLTPYVCVTNVERDMVSWDGESAFSNLLLLRRVLGVLDTRRPTVEGDENLKDLMQATFAALNSAAAHAAFQALNVKSFRIVNAAPDGLGPIQQAAFVWDIEFVIAGAGVMRG